MKLIIGVFFLVVLLITSFPAILPAESTDSKDKPWERFSLALGGFVTQFNSSVTLGGKELGTGINIDVEDALGLDTSLAVFRADALFRLGASRRHRLDFGYYDLRRSATKTLQTDVEMGDNTYPVGTTVDSFLNIKVIKAGYSYSLIQDDRIDLGLGVGLFVMPIDVGVNSVRIGSSEESITAPLPTVVLRADVALTPKWFIRQSIEAFYLEVGSFRGGLFSGLFALEYKPWKHLGFGAGYNFFRLGIKSEGSDYPNIDLTGKIEFNYSGLLLYGKLFF